jgi:hypothetical protein
MGMTKVFAAFGVVLALLATAADAQQSNNDDVRELLRTLVNREPRPAVTVLRGRPSSDITSRSYFGGLPRLPANVQWPVSTLTNQPMFFVAQIDLAEVPRIEQREGLPEQGMLWFFLAYDGIIEERERVVVLYDPRSGMSWPERAPPPRLGRIIDELPYFAFDATDPLAQLDLPSPMRFAPVTSFHQLNPPPEGADHQLGDVDAASRFRRQQIEAALGPMTDGPYQWEAPHELDIDEWPYVGFTAELAAGVVAAQLPPLDIYPRAEPNTVWSRQGRRLREQLAEEAREHQQRWRRKRFESLSAEQRAEFRAWIASVRARAEAMPRQQTGGYSLYYSITNYTIRQTDLFAGYAGLARGVDSALPPRYRTPYDWIGRGPPHDQMLGYGWSDQSAPVEHALDVLLLQIEGGDNIFWLPECMLHFWIPRQALAARRFDYTSATLECD